ncbi:hypothetical protein HK100_002233 [Physocladia obscura]|uniref:Uncharacterized protein n=1 Tax=Physocladia obscura TaxID=109957 RepID=A0AAD5SXC9_9FUNG|nr:hypothetical protein HK100_002233 [Physocladia obscura]
MTMPLKAKAVITLLAPSSTIQSKSFDFYTLSTFLQAFIHLQNPSTRLSNFTESEFVVMTTIHASPEIRESLVLLGARILIVPSIQPSKNTPARGSQFEFVYTKLNLWRLEGVYDQILFIDVDLFLLQDTIASDLFKILSETLDALSNNSSVATDSTRKNVLMGVKDCCVRPIELNVGLMLFEPSLLHFTEMYRVAMNPPFNRHFEQSLISEYFLQLNRNGSSGGIEWLNDVYNVQLAVSEMTNATRGFHYKFWSTQWYHSDEIFALWRNAMRGLRRLQLKIGSPLVVPVFPDTFKEWELIREGGRMFDSVALYSLFGGKKSQEFSRQQVARQLNQADYYVQQYNDGVGGAFLEISEKLLTKYDWVWLLAPGVYFSPDALVHKFLADIVSPKMGDSAITLFNDCNHEGNKFGSVLIGKAAKKMLKQFSKDMLLKHQGDSELWADMGLCIGI